MNTNEKVEFEEDPRIMNEKLTTAEFLYQLRDMGVELWVDEDKLRFNAPNDVITSSLREELSRRKTEIMRFFADSASSSGSEIIPLQPVSGDGVLPVSFSQERLWFLSQMEPDSAAYVIPLGMRMQGKLNVEAFERSMNEIIRRHEVLRTTFKESDGRPEQVVSPPTGKTFPLVDLQELPVDEREAEVQRLINEEVQHPFDLTKGPLFRPKLVRLGEEEHVLFIAMHHIIYDGWSAGIIIKELGLHYKSFLSGKPSSLPELPIQYADYSHWQREWLKGEVLERQLDYWKNQLKGDLPVLQLPLDRPRPAVQAYRGTSKSFVLSERLKMGLKKLSRDERVTMFMTLLTAFYTLLYRYTGQEDITVGSPVANRTRSEIENLIGFFVNTLVLRGDMSGTPSFAELLGRVREVTLAAYNHQDLPFEKLVEIVNPEREMSHSPLFQVMFIWQNYPMESGDFPGLTLTPVATEENTSRFDLTLYTRERDQGLSGSVEYNTDLFDDATIVRMQRHFQTLLEGIVADPGQCICDLPILDDAERRQILVDWNATETAYPRDVCIHDLFEAQVEQTPDAVALVFGEDTLTYDELNTRANHLAHYLHQQYGVGPEVCVGVCVERSLEMVVGILGILKAGGAYVPLDPNAPPGRLAFMLKDAGIAVLLTQAHLRANLPEFLGTVLALDADWDTALSVGNLMTKTSTANLAYVIYTSGSTGTPKGVMIPHSGVVNYLSWATSAYEMAQGDGAPVYSSLGFDFTITSLFGPLVVGQRIILLPEEIRAEELCELLHLETELSVLKITPAHLELMRTRLSQEDFKGRPRFLIIGGEALLGEHLAVWQEQFPTTRVINEYGPTEGVVGCCTFEVPTSDPLIGPVLIGRPSANTQLYVLDYMGQLVPMGVQGELYIGGTQVARGYLGRPDLTAERFVPHPFSAEPGARLYRTGDQARYRADGTLEFLGRVDHQVKLRGFRIELGEIEAVMMQHPGIQEAVALVREDRPSDPRLVAYVVASHEPTPTFGELRSFLKEKLPDYMIPSAFVFLDLLPLTPNGKVDRQAFPVPDAGRPDIEESFAVPRNAVEEALAEIWGEVLRIEKVGIQDNFFELGGHSLMATQIISRLSNVFQVEVPLRQLFLYPTIAELALIIAGMLEKTEQENVKQLLDEFENLSDEEADRLLAQELRQNDRADRSE